MIPILFREYTVKMSGSIHKLIYCVDCSTDFVIRMERTTKGGGLSFYHLDNQGALDRAWTAAERELTLALQYEIDPVPCPACGHYQDYMIPTMRRLRWKWLIPVVVALIVLGFLTLLVSIYFTVKYVDRNTDANLENMISAWSVVVSLWLGAIGLPIVKYFRFRSFNPNLEDQQVRIAIGLSRALTLAEFEKAQGGESPDNSDLQLGVIRLNKDWVDTRTQL